MSLSLAIVGFRHPHILDLVKRVQPHPQLHLVAVCEEDEATRAQLSQSPPCEQIFDSYPQMLDSVSCDVVAVGDAYGLRGGRTIEALRRGLHVISDKPICTRGEELETIVQLSREKELCIGCQFDLRDHANFLALRQLVRGGDIGEVCAISFGGQHPLNYGARAAWYFEPQQHGGTLNDIAIHAFDFVPWIVGSPVSHIRAARAWNAHFAQVPHFQNAAQVVFELENGAGVMGDVSYLMPDSFGYALPHYWRTTIWGTHGIAETNYTVQGVQLYRNGATEAQTVTATAHPGGYLEAFLREVEEETLEDAPTTETNLAAQRVALAAQEAAELGK